MNEATQARRRPVGAEMVPGGGVEFRVWALGRRKVEVVLEGGPGSASDDGPPTIRLRRDGKGYFAVRVASAGAGTRYRFRLDGGDPRDGLLHPGAEGYQLTWMDARVGDWVVTPRRGKAVEINALWCNALRLLEGTRNWDAARLPGLPLAVIRPGPTARPDDFAPGPGRRRRDRGDARRGRRIGRSGAGRRARAELDHRTRPAGRAAGRGIHETPWWSVASSK
jgi:Amylo-alpha-1,6-glucosidase